MSTENFSISSVWCHRCRAGGTATTTPPWKASGDCSKMNWCITGALRPAPRPFRPSLNASKYFTGGSANRHVWDICLLSHLSANSMKIGWRHEPVVSIIDNRPHSIESLLHASWITLSLSGCPSLRAKSSLLSFRSLIAISECRDLSSPHCYLRPEPA